MKRTIVALAVAGIVGVQALALDIPYANKGVDGVFHPTGSQHVVDLSKAVTGRWDDPQTTPLEPGGWGVGIYDPEKWAVVFKFSSVTVPAGTTVTFKNHPSRAPVVWLVDGDVTIGGEVGLSGGSGPGDPVRLHLSEPGPGGFRGGDGVFDGVGATSGLGPGGAHGDGRLRGPEWGGIAGPSHATPGAAWNSTSPPLYGNSRILPLIGGSGAGPYSDNIQGTAGGGALLIASSSRCEINGHVHAYGGNRWGAGGSGGAIRIVAEQVTGQGEVGALGAQGGGHGRVRIEANRAGTVATRPFTWPVPPDSPVRLWPDSTAPVVRIVSVGGMEAPADPRAEVFLGLEAGARPADLALPFTRVTNSVLVETFHLPTNALVELRVVSIPTGGDIRVNAMLAGVDPGNPARLTWMKDVVMPPGVHVLQVRAEAP